MSSSMEKPRDVVGGVAVMAIGAGFLLFGQELDDTLEKEKRRESAPAAVVTEDQPKQKSTGHDELTKVCAAEEAGELRGRPW